MQLHGAAQGLLRTLCHGVCLVQDYQLVPARRQRHLFGRKHFNLVPHDVYAAVVRCIQLQHGVF